MKLSNLGEFGLINRLTSSVKNGAGIITGIGDDAAITALTPGMQLLTSTDMLLEDVHFRRSWHDPFLLGRKSLAVNLSDIAAMGAIPRWATLSLGIPPDVSLEFMDKFSDGFLAIANEYGVTLIGGDTCRSKSGLVINVTIMGEQIPENIVRRCGANVGDEIWVTGHIGDAALGLKFLEDSVVEADGFAFMRSRILNPTPRISTGIAIAQAGLATAMIDISDGIVSDFGHIAQMSNVGGIIHCNNLPLSKVFHQWGALLPEFPWYIPLSGGEDYELCFTANPRDHEKIDEIVKKSGVMATAVGIVTDSKNVVVVDKNALPLDLKYFGFNHFS